jgi:hypothetical protein
LLVFLFANSYTSNTQIIRISADYKQYFAFWHAFDIIRIDFSL